MKNAFMPVPGGCAGISIFFLGHLAMIGFMFGSTQGRLDSSRIGLTGQVIHRPRLNPKAAYIVASEELYRHLAAQFLNALLGPI